MPKTLHILLLVSCFLFACKQEDPYKELKQWNNLRTSNPEFCEVFQYAYCNNQVEFFDSITHELNTFLSYKESFGIEITDSCDIKTNELRVQYNEFVPDSLPEFNPNIAIRIHMDGISFQRLNTDEGFKSFLQRKFSENALSESHVSIHLDTKQKINWNLLFSTLREVFREVHAKRELMAQHKKSKLFDSLNYGEKCLIAGKEALHINLLFKK